MYIEASAPRVTNDKARLISPVRGQTSAECVTFYYSMYGNTMGTLNLYMMVNGNRGSPIWSRSGDQGKNWILGSVTVKSPSNFQVCTNCNKNENSPVLADSHYIQSFKKKILKNQFYSGNFPACDIKFLDKIKFSSI